MQHNRQQMEGWRVLYLLRTIAVVAQKEDWNLSGRRKMLEIAKCVLIYQGTNGYFCFEFFKKTPKENGSEALYLRKGDDIHIYNGECPLEHYFSIQKQGHRCTLQSSFLQFLLLKGHPSSYSMLRKMNSFLWAHEPLPESSVQGECGLLFSPTCPFGLASLCREQPHSSMQQGYSHDSKVPVSLEHAVFSHFLIFVHGFLSSECKTGHFFKVS